VRIDEGSYNLEYDVNKNHNWHIVRNLPYHLRKS